jgi:hypothetical protein
MTHKEQGLGNLLDRIADELNITPTMMEKAIQSYQAVGEWIGDGLDYEVVIKPQGSMNLGTVIRPIDDSDDYDMDLVCLLKDGYKLPSEQLKKIVGDRLKENRTYQKMLEKEGKRCWTMQYDEFHMDILPCSSKDKVYLPDVSTAIRLTHKLDNGLYIDKYSDPEAYHDWFVNRMTGRNLVDKSFVYAERNTEIDKVPTYKQRTTLQKAIQLLKRHRDIMFAGCEDNAPISIIITTLAAWAYNGESNVFDVLRNILSKMPKHIKQQDGMYYILNPVMEEENFADKWNENRKKADAFFSWLAAAKSDLLENPLSFAGIDAIGNELMNRLGEAPVKRALNKHGIDTKNSRSKGTLYVNGTMGGLGAATTSAVKVKEHTFFGS